MNSTYFSHFRANYSKNHLKITGIGVPGHHVSGGRLGSHDAVGLWGAAGHPREPGRVGWRGHRAAGNLPRARLAVPTHTARTLPIWSSGPAGGSCQTLSYGDPNRNSWTGKGCLGREADPTLETLPANGKEGVGRREEGMPHSEEVVCPDGASVQGPSSCRPSQVAGRARVRGGLFPELGVRADAGPPAGRTPPTDAHAQLAENEISKRRSGQLADHLPEVNEQVTAKLQRSPSIPGSRSLPSATNSAAAFHCPARSPALALEWQAATCPRPIGVSEKGGSLQSHAGAAPGTAP